MKLIFKKVLEELEIINLNNNKVLKDKRQKD